MNRVCAASEMVSRARRSNHMPAGEEMMFARFRPTIGACLAAAAMSGLTFAQETVPLRRPADGAIRPVPAGARVEVHRLSTVMKSKVVIQQDQPVGQIVDFVLNDGGCIDYVVASYEDQYYAIPYSAVVLRHTDRVVFVDISPAQFRKVTFFAANQWPDFTSTNYQQNVISVFGVSSIRNDGPNTTLKPNLDRRDDRRDPREDRRNRNDDGTAGEHGGVTPRKPPTNQPVTPQAGSQPKTEQPKTEQPKAEQPKAEKPKAEKPKAEKPKPISPSP
jgi:hypothetical protein